MPQPSVPSNLEIVHDVYAALARGDGPAVFAVIGPEVVWNEAENFRYADGNPYTSVAAIGKDIFMRLGGEWDGFKAFPAEFLDAGASIVAMGRYTGVYKATGAAVDAQFAHVWWLKDGKISRFQQYTDTAQYQRVIEGSI